MTESYPYQRSAAAPGGDAESHRLSARLKQDLVQLAADQRQLKQQRTALDRLKAELDTRQQELDAAVQSFQQQRQLFEQRKQSAELDFDQRERNLDSGRQGFDARQQDLDARQREVDARQQKLEVQQRDLDAGCAQIRQQQEALNRRAAELQAAEEKLQERAVQLDSRQTDLQEREKQWRSEADRLEARRRDLDARQEKPTPRQQELDTRQRDLDARQQELDARQQQLDARQQEMDTRQRDLDAGREQIRQQQKDLTRRAAELQAAEQELHAKVAQLDSRQSDLRERERQSRSEADRLEDKQQDLEAQQRDVLARQQELDAWQQDIEARRQDLDARQRGLDARQQDLDARHVPIRQQQEAITRGRAELLAAERDLEECRARLGPREADLQARAASLAELQRRLTDKQRCLEELETELGRRQQSLELATAAAQTKPPASDDSRLAAAREQIATLSGRLQDAQAEVEELRRHERQAVARSDELARQCSTLQNHVHELTAAQKDLLAGAAAAQPAAPTVPDDLAALAAHAVRVRRRASRAARPPHHSRAGPRTAVAATLAVAMGLLAGLGVFRVQAARYRLLARIMFAPNSPLASGPELAKAQRELGGRLLEAQLPGVVWPADRPPVLADAKVARLTVQVLTVSPEASQRGLRDVLMQYRSELEGSIQDAARAQQDRQLAEQVSGAEIQLKQLAGNREALEAAAARFQPQVKAYQDAAAAAEKARKELEEAGRRAADVSARLRVLQRTPPGTRGEASPDRIAAAAAADVQLAEVRSQVIARAAVLQDLLRGLLTSALAKCDRMDGLLDGFGKLVAGQQEQISDQALRGETARVGQQASRLKDVVQRCRSQIDDLSNMLAQSQDLDQAASLVAVQAKSEKALEALTSEAATAIQQVDDLLEKIPAGGVDVTRRTVLQQRLRSQFAEVQQAQHEMSETLNGLRPAVNFRLDAALTAVSGLARRYQDRYKALAEQIQQQDAHARRQEYDRQVQQAQAEREDLAVESDRLLARLTEASGQMLDADAGRSRFVQIRWQIDEVDRRIAAANADLEAARQRQANLQSAASQPAVASLEDPQILVPAANRTARIAAAVVAGMIVSLLSFGAYALAVRYSSGRPIPPSPAGQPPTGDTRS